MKRGSPRVNEEFFDEEPNDEGQEEYLGEDFVLEDDDDEGLHDEFRDIAASGELIDSFNGTPSTKKIKTGEKTLESTNFWCEKGFGTHPDTFQKDENVLQGGDGFDMMMMDMEMVMAPRKRELDQEYDLSQIYDWMDEVDSAEKMNSSEQLISPYRYKRNIDSTVSLDDRRTTVPLIKIYGREKTTSASVCVNVYGFYPKILLKLSENLDDALIRELLKFVRDTSFEAACKSSKKTLNKSSYHPSKYPVLAYDVVTRFIAYPYVPAPTDFIQLTLASPSLMNAIAKVLVNDQNTFYSKSRGKNISVSVFGEIDYISQLQLEKKIYGFTWFKVHNKTLQIESREDPDDGTVHHSEHLLSLNYQDIDGTEDPTANKNHNELPNMKVMCLDIECLSKKGLPNSSVDPIILICCRCVHLVDGVEDKSQTRDVTLQLGKSFKPIGDPKKDIHKCFEKEEDMLEYFNALNVQFDPDFLVGHNVVDFDIKYITERSHTLGCSSMFMGKRTFKEWKPAQEVTKRRSFLTIKTFKTLTPGRIQLDTLVFMKAKSPESSYKLGALGDKYIGMGKEDVGYKMIKPLFETSDKTRMRLAKYCMQDVNLTWLLCTHDKFDMISDTVSFAQSPRIVPSKLVRCGVQEKLWLSLWIKALTPGWNYEGKFENTPAVFPSIKKEKEKEDEYKKMMEALPPDSIESKNRNNIKCKGEPAAKKKKFDGANVLQPLRKWYKNLLIAVLDYASLYPSIMICFNIDYGTIIKNGYSSHLDPNIYRTSPVGASFVKEDVRRGLIPSVLNDWLAARAMTRAAMKTAPNKNVESRLNSKQLSLKIICNSFYGFTGAGTGKIVELMLSTSVTAYGREAIGIAKATAEAAPYFAKVVYGDTDSIFVLFPNQREQNLGLKEIFALMAGLANRITAQVRSPMKIEPEKVYRNLLLVDKKRYCGLKFMSANDTKPKIDAKGLESARRDICPYLKKTMEKLMDKLTSGADLDSIRKMIKEVNIDIMTEKVPITELVVSKSMTKPAEEYKVIPAHIELAYRMQSRDPSYPVAPGERIPYVIAENPNLKKKDKVLGRLEDPLWAITHDIQVDYRFYLDNYIAPALTRLLMWVFPDLDLSNQLRTLEEKIREIDEKAANPTEKRELEKPWNSEKKSVMGRMQKRTLTEFFGEGALSEIPKRKQRKLNTGLENWVKMTSKCPSCQVNMIPDGAGMCKTCKNQWAKLKKEAKAYDSFVFDSEDPSAKCVVDFYEKSKKEMEKTEEKEVLTTEKCDKCRGYSSNDIKCLQRDCLNLYERATANKKRMDLVKLMKIAFD